MDTQLKNVMKRQRRVQSAAAKDITKISAPGQKSDAATVEMTNRHSQETAQYSKKKRNRPDPNERTHTQTTGHTETSQNNPTSRINPNAVKKTPLTELHRNPLQDQNKKDNPSLVKTTHRLYCPTATDTILREKVKKSCPPPHH